MPSVSVKPASPPADVDPGPQPHRSFTDELLPVLPDHAHIDTTCRHGSWLAQWTTGGGLWSVALSQYQAGNGDDRSGVFVSGPGGGWTFPHNDSVARRVIGLLRVLDALPGDEPTR